MCEHFNDLKELYAQGKPTIFNVASSTIRVEEESYMAEMWVWQGPGHQVLVCHDDCCGLWAMPQ